MSKQKKIFKYSTPRCQGQKLITKLYGSGDFFNLLAGNDCDCDSKPGFCIPCTPTYGGGGCC